MNLLLLPLELPALPVTSVVRLAEILRDEAERQYHDPADVNRALEEIDAARESGELSEEEAAQAEAETVERLVRPSADEGEVAGDA